MRTYLTNGRILTPETTLHGKAVAVEGHRIAGILPEPIQPQEDDRVIDVQGAWIVPGMIDLHVHGALGYDTMDATPQAIAEMGRFFARHGVTSYLPTTVSASKVKISKAVENLAHCPQPEDGAHSLGIHLEGPYLNPIHRGAQPTELLRDADPAEYQTWLEYGVIKLVSLAPERPGALDFIRSGIQQGIEFSIAHSAATYEQVIQATDDGLRQASHTFNGMSGLHHREPGVVGAVLSDERIYAQIIPDGIHVHPAVVKILVKTKGIDHTIIVTDAIRAVGLTDGVYDLGEEKITVKNGISRTPSGSLAGSTLTMDQAVRNMMAFTGLSFETIFPMASSAPAKAMGWYGKKGVIMPGADADILILDHALQVYLTMIAGKIVFQK